MKEWFSHFVILSEQSESKDLKNNENIVVQQKKRSVKEHSVFFIIFE